jgi:predicted PurR-regulated permease PerM
MKERLVRERIFFFGMVLFLIVIAFFLIKPFITPILFALALVVILKPLYNRLLAARWVKGSEKRAAAATLVIFLLVIAIPVFFIISAAISQAASLFTSLEFDGLDFSPQEIIASVEAAIQQIGVEGFQLDELSIGENIQESLGNLASWLGSVAVSLGQSLPRLFTNWLIILVVIVVLLPLYRRPGKQDIMELVPFPEEITQLFMDKFNMMIIAMFKGTFIIAFAQGAIMGVVFWIAGVPYTMFLTILSMFLSLVPLVGISLVAWPVGIILLLTGQVWQGIFVIAAFLIVIANVDTILRPRLVPKGAYLNPALVILSVFGGLQLMGLIGALYGPVIMILLITSIEVYTKYMLRSDLEILLADGDVDLEELGLAIEEDEERPDGAVMTTLKNLAKRFHQGASQGELDEAAGLDLPGG